MTYIQLTDDSFVVSIKGSLHTVGRRFLNYNKIKKLLQDENNENNEDKILDLLKPVELNNGIYEVFEHVKTRSLLIDHYTKEGTVKTTRISPGGSNATKEDHTFVGVYASIEEVRTDWPEYML